MRFESPERFLVPSNRASEVALGSFVAILSLIFVSLAVYVLGWGVLHGLLKGPYDRGWMGFLLVPTVLLVLGAPGCWIAFRLLTGRARRDGGLFSPGVLRLSGAMLLLAPWPWLIANPRDPWRWWHATTMLSAAVACWILADRRDRRDEPERSTNVISSRPLD